MRYYIIAGEASGDLHGGNLMKGLYASDSDAVIRFWGGGEMESAYRAQTRPGGGLAKDYREGAVMGIVEVISALGRIGRNLAFCKKDIAAFRPDALILIDYPGFNMKIAAWAHKNNFRTFYYIAPKVWASREWRVKKLRRDVDRTFIIFPFEKEYFTRQQVPWTYCGNPLVDSISESGAMTLPREELYRSCGIENGTPLLAMLAGSRKGEIDTMMPELLKTAEIIHSTEGFKNYIFTIAGAPGRTEEDYLKAVSGQELPSYVKLIFGHTRELVKLADAALINSGTASLEAVLLDTPQVVAYKFASKLTTALARKLIKVKYLSLGNLCLDRLAFRELYLDNFNAREMARELVRLINDKKYRALQKAEYAAIRESLGGTGASLKVAEEIIRLVSSATSPEENATSSVGQQDNAQG